MEDRKGVGLAKKPKLPKGSIEKGSRVMLAFYVDLVGPRLPERFASRSPAEPFEPEPA
jgi:hypothetical protein